MGRVDQQGYLAIAAVAVLSIATACGSDRPPGESLRSDAAYAPASLNEASAVHDVVGATTTFGAEALAFFGDSRENVVLSPASVVIALAMLAEGADGPAVSELETFLGASADERTAAFSALQAAVLEYDGDPSIVQEDELPEEPLLHLANHFVLREGAEVDPDFLDVLARAYDSGMSEADFTSDASQSLLDEWIEHHTGGLIEESAIDLPDEDLVFVLQNAVLLAAQWQSPFEESGTFDRDFTKGDGETVEVETMHQVLGASYTEHDGAQAIRLPYTEAFAFDVILPAEGVSPGSFTAEDWTTVDEAFSTGDFAQLDLALPRLDIETEIDFIPLLRDELGLESTVRGHDLSGIADIEVYLSQVEHQAVLQVDEQGTVAAAVTEIAARETSAQVPEEEVIEMHVDRPFALRIVHIDTSWPLFMGTIYDPAS